MNQTYVKVNSGQLGPLDDSLILTSLNNGVFKYSDLCIRDGWPSWKPLSDVYPQPSSQGETRHASPPSPEHTIWQGRTSLVNFSTSIFFIGVLLIAMIAAPILVNTDTAQRMGDFHRECFGAEIVFLSLLLLVSGRFFTSYLSKEYRITDRRVVLVLGVAIKSERMILIKDIRSLSVTKNAFTSALFDVGDVVISCSATDDDEIVMEGVRHASKVRNTIAGIQDQLA